MFNLLKDTLREWREDGATRLAAALAYYTTFSLAPLLNPSWVSFGVQLLLAGLLWACCWLWLNWGSPPALRLDSQA